MEVFFSVTDADGKDCPDVPARFDVVSSPWGPMPGVRIPASELATEDVPTIRARVPDGRGD